MRTSRPKLIPGAALCLLPLAASADIEIERWNPAGLSQPDGYSQLVTVKGATKTILLGGKAGIYPDGSFPPTLAGQSKQMWQNVATALKAAGAGPEDVVEIQVFIVDLANANPELAYDDIRAFFPAGHKPVSMVIGVSALAYDGLLIEVNVRAMVAD